MERIITFLLLSEDTAVLLSQALDVSLYPAIRAWGFTTGDYQVPSEEQLTNLLARVGHSGIKT